MTVPENPRHVPSTLALELILGALTAFAPLSVDMYLPALPAISGDFHVSAASVQLTLASFFVGLAIGQFSTGPLIDRFGRTRPLYAGLALYVLGSAGCAFAPGIGALILFRFLQALGSSVALVVPRAVVRDLQSGAAAAQMMSRLVLVMGIAPILAPLVGGALLRLFGWRAIFLVLVTVGAVSLLVVFFALPETSPQRRAGTNHAAQFAALLRDPDFVGHALTGAFAQATMFAYIAGSSFVFITLYNVPPERFGWFFGSNAAGLIFTSQLNRALLARFSPSQIVRWTILWTSFAGGLVWLVTATGLGHFWGLAASLFLLVSSLGSITPNTAALALEHHGQRAGLASAILGALQFAIAATASWAVSAAYNGTAAPMGAVIAVAAVLSGSTLAMTRWLVRRSVAGHPKGS